MRTLAASVLAVVLSAGLAGCAARSRSAWEFYDECAMQNPASFQAMVACGKERRLAYCQSDNSCSATGNDLMMYADSLVQSVARREMSEAEAQRKWIEFKQARVDERNRLIATIAAGNAASRRTCVQTGNITNCY